MLSSPPNHLLIFHVLCLNSMKGTSAQSLTQKYPRRGAEEKENSKIKRKRKKSTREKEWVRATESMLVIFMKISLTDIEIKIEWGRKSEIWKRKIESLLYSNVLCSIIIVTAGSSVLWLVLNIPAQNAHTPCTLTHINTPTPLHLHSLHPHLHTNAHTRS